MTNEIKKILDYLKDKKGYAINEFGAHKELTPEENNKLLDYITNLQEENEKSKEYIEFYKDMTDKWKDMTNVFKESSEDYKQRIDKAVEYLEQPYRDNFDYSKAELLNILRGDE